MTDSALYSRTACVGLLNGVAQLNWARDDNED